MNEDTVDLTRVEEYRIGEPLRRELHRLLRECFAEYPQERIYYKQLPHFRVVARDAGELVGQVGVEHRAVSAGGRPATIFGVVDLCVAASHRSRGVGSALLGEVERLARECAVDYVVLFADDHRVYLANGYRVAANPCRWVMIDEHRTLGIADRPLADCFMVKPVAGPDWPDGEVDLLGHVF